MAARPLKFVSDPSLRAEPLKIAPSSWGGCPGSGSRSLRPERPAGEPARVAHAPAPGAAAPSELAHWPIQLKLVSPLAPFLQGAELLLAADCGPFACADFHARFLAGKALLIACPKLDDGTEAYVEKLAAIVAQAGVKRVLVVRMEVPCCGGLTRIAQLAVARSGRDIPVEEAILSIRGELQSTRPVSIR
jgi:hypothetical protein